MELMAALQTKDCPGEQATGNDSFYQEEKKNANAESLAPLLEPFLHGLFGKDLIEFHIARHRWLNFTLYLWLTFKLTITKKSQISKAPAGLLNGGFGCFTTSFTDSNATLTVKH